MKKKITSEEDLQGLSELGSGKKNIPNKKLETFPNHSQERFYLVKLETNEFTCICPKTGQPDFASISIYYVPDKKIVESKSLKLYFWSFRDEGVFHEHLVNTILDDLVKALDPHYCIIIGRFNARGGISIDVSAEHCKTNDAKEIWKSDLYFGRKS
jgi:7-cyano-7-deazaguanine reductase